MSSRLQHGFDLANVYVHLEPAGTAARIEGGEAFGKDLAAGSPVTPDAKRVAAGSGWLIAAREIMEDPDHWEMHPEGEEILFVRNGEMHVILDEQGVEKLVELIAGMACIVPRNVWHRIRVVTPGDLVAITWGKGTEQRPLQSNRQKP
jgi:mannose-6-phosphate isomerase-like protein (cupin superfamily)